MRALVTGGGGFLGAALARKLRERGDEVRVFGRGSYPDLEAIGIDCAKGDITDYASLHAACDDREVVFHVAAKVGLWGRYEDFHAVNVEGTKNVLRACLEHGIRKLVFTGSPSVVFHGGDVDGVDESAPIRQAGSVPEEQREEVEEIRHPADDAGVVIPMDGGDEVVRALRARRVAEAWDIPVPGEGVLLGVVEGGEVEAKCHIPRHFRRSSTQQFFFS